MLLLPFNAEHYYFVTDVERKQRLARVASERLVQDHTVAIGTRPRWSTVSGRVRAGLDGALARLVRVRGGRSALVGDEVAATPPV